ncbi:MAG: poly-beta-hydroxybutyrate polymerase, partial [Rubrivivax sp.]|nr:poly-beta-hydroxybutyrate polymerase [Rubrivivax sp.]
DIDWPVFLVGTEKDHVAPWRSVYKLHRLTDAEITFVLCNGGHNAGIVSEPGHPGRRWRQHCRPPGGAWLPPDAWCAASVEHEGSWWTAWDAWLRAKGSGRQVPARRIVPADALAAAPGNYVKVRYAD